MNPDKLKQNIIAMEEQGASQEEVQAYIDSVKGSVSEEEGGSMLGDIGRAIIKTPARIVGSFAPAVDMAMGKSQEEIAQRNVEGRDFGIFGKNIKPFGWQASDKSQGTLEQTGRMAADVAGGAAELASYAFAPLRGATSFLGMLGQAATSKGTALYVGGEVLKDVGEGKSATQTGTEGLMDYAGSTVSTAIFGKGGKLIHNWGARMLGSEATQVAYKGVQDVFDRIFNVSDQFPSSMKDIDDATRNAFLHNINTEKRSFDTAFGKLKNAFIERMQPTITSRGQVFMKVQQGARNLMRNLFDDKNAKYADFGAADVPLTNFSKTKEIAESLLNKADDALPAIPEGSKKAFDSLIKQGVSAIDAARSLGIEVAEQAPNPLAGIMTQIKNVADNGVPNPGVILRLNRQLLDAAKTADDETGEVLRETAFALFSDTATMLNKAGREDLVKLWDEAWQGHKKALDLVTSKMYRSFINSGEFDTFFSKFTAGKLDNEAQEKFFETLTKESPAEMRDLILDNIMNKIHKGSPEEGVKILDGFLGEKGSKMFSFAKSVLNDEDMAFMYGMRDFLDYNFDDAVLAAKVLKQPVGEAMQSMTEMMRLKGRLDVKEAIQKLDVDGFGEGITQLFQKNPELVGSIITQMTAQEKQMTRFSMLRRVFDSKAVVGITNPDGSGLIDETFIKMAADTIDDVTATSRRVGNKTVFGLFDEKQIIEMKNLLKLMNKYSDLQTVPASELDKIKSGIFAAFYGLRGWIPGTIANTQKALKGVTEEEQLYYEAVASMNKKLAGKKGTTMLNVGDFLMALGDQVNISPAFTEGLEAVTTDADKNQ